VAVGAVEEVEVVGEGIEELSCDETFGLRVWAEGCSRIMTGRQERLGDGL
jgi:putative component of toxin-antitoxin plasmid stabilization module